MHDIGAPRSPEAEKVREKLLADLDAFSSDFEAQERERVAQEAETQRQKKAALEEWAKAETKKREDFERTRDGASSLGETTVMRRGALDMLKKQAADRPPVENKALMRAQAVEHIHKNLQAAFQYLAEFSTELNGASPTTDRPLDFVFLKAPSPVTLSEAFCDYRPTKVGGNDVIDHVQLRYQARYTKPAIIEAVGGEVQRCGDFLKLHRVTFTFREKKKDDFGKATAGTFLLNGPIRCELVLRANYDNPAVNIELLNIGQIGTASVSMPGKDFEHELADELARFVLGVDNDFEKRLKR
jgi:hypothetical protein